LPLNRHSTKINARTICTFGLMIDIEEVPKDRDSRLCLKINLTEDLELTQIGQRVGSNILRMKVVEIKEISEEFGPGW
jgi:hypothetical protein